MLCFNYYPLSVSFMLLAFSAGAQLNADSDITSERSMYSKVYLNSDGSRKAIISPSPIHYKSNGSWQDIYTTITADNNGFRNESNVIQSYFPNKIDSMQKIKLIVNSKDVILIDAEKKPALLNSSGNINVMDPGVNNSTANVSKNTIDYPGIYTGVTDGYVILSGGIKNNIVLSAVPEQLNNLSSGYFGFQEKLYLPKGWNITLPSHTHDSLTSSSLSITDSGGNAVLTIPEPIFFDNYILDEDGAHSVEGMYLVKQCTGGWTITTLVPVAWLKDANTRYPLSIDPTVIIAGSTGGWQSPVNFVDNPGFVFVGVCCGNSTHRGWIKFNISGIPSNSCITDVEFQPYVGTEASTSPETVLINDVTGAFGPYGAINPAAYTDFGNGNYTSFVLTVLGIYGFYPLGAGACAQLQSLLPGGWFQLAFQFLNEPSTDWKNMNATSSNLKVIYTAPPCVLPVNLISFSGTCDNGKTNLTWATASQTNNKLFTVERSSNGITFDMVGTVAGAGNSNQTLYYSLVDPAPLNGTSYYRLKQTDFDGHSEYKQTIALNCYSNAQIDISPNPCTGLFFIQGAEQNSLVTVTNTLGQVVCQTKITGERTEMDLSAHSNGIYFIQIISDNGTVSRKLLLNK